jgi:hypothetical protein
MNQLNATSSQRLSNAVAAGTSAINSSSIDLANTEGAIFRVLFGAITSGAVTSVKLQASDDNGSADDWTDLEGSAITVADTDDNKIAELDLSKPRKRYARVVVSRATQNSVVDGITAVPYGVRNQPAAQHSTVLGRKVLVSPAEGTA